MSHITKDVNLKDIECSMKVIVANALREDRIKKDITTDSFIPKYAKVSAKIIAKEEGVICGLPIAEKIFKTLDKDCKFKGKDDKENAKKGDAIAEINGNTRAILTGERIALNFLQHLSGIATETRKYVDAAAGKFDIYDTRKTHPGLRLLEKYAVVCGGGKNHRLRLDDLVLIKDNHLEYLKHMDKGKLNNTIGKLKRTHKVEIECSTPEEVEFALSLYPDIIMLDNMENGTMANAIAVVRKSLPQTLIEVSGEMNIDKIKQIANSALDIDFVSVGKITHSAKDIDFSLEFDKI